MKLKISIIGSFLFSGLLFCQEPNTSEEQLKITEADSLYKHATNLYFIQKKYKEAKLQSDIVDSLY